MVLLLVCFQRGFSQNMNEEEATKDAVFVIDMSPPMAGAVMDSMGRYQYSAAHDHRKQVANHIHSVLDNIDTTSEPGAYLSFITFSSDILEYRYFEQADTGLFQARKYIDSLMALPPAHFTKKTNICRMLDLLPEYMYDIRGGASVYLYLSSSQQTAYGSKGSMCLAGGIYNYCERVFWDDIEHYWLLLGDFLTPTQQYNITYACYNHAIIPYPGNDQPLKQILDIHLPEERFIVNVRNDSVGYRLPIHTANKLPEDWKIDSLKVAVLTNWHPQISAMPELVSIRNGSLQFSFRNMLSDTVLLKNDGRFLGMLKLLDFQDDNYYYNFTSDTIQMELRASEPAKLTVWPLCKEVKELPDTLMPEDRINLGSGTIGDTLTAYLPVEFNKKAIDEHAIVYFKVLQEDGYKLDTSEVLVHVNNYQRHWIFELDANDYDEGINYVPVKFVINGPIGKKKILTIKLDRTERLDGGVWLIDQPYTRYAELELELDTYYYPLTHLSPFTWVFSGLILATLVFAMWIITIYRPVFTRGYLYFYIPELQKPTMSLRYKHKFTFSSLGLPTGDMQISNKRFKNEQGKWKNQAVLSHCPSDYRCLVNGREVGEEYVLQNFDEVLVMSPDAGKKLMRVVYNNPRS